MFTALGELKRQWEGDKSALKIVFGDERCIKVVGRVVAEQNKETGELLWRIRKEDIKTEELVFAARQVQ